MCNSFMECTLLAHSVHAEMCETKDAYVHMHVYSFIEKLTECS